MRIDTSSWEYFKISDLFEVKSTKTTPVEVLEEMGRGKIPYITTQATNNGVAGYYNMSTEKGNVLTIDSAVAGQCFYQPVDFSASDHVEKLVPKFELDLKLGLFLQTIINMEQYKYSYGRKRSQRVIKNERIKLPATPEGEPDWKYMEEFVGGCQVKPLTTSNKPSGRPLDVSDWGEFRVGDLFDVELSNGDIKAGDAESGDVVLVSSGESNNGVVKHISKEGDGKANIFDGNKITIDMFGNAFYQEEPFYAVSHGRVNILSPKFELNKYIGLFMASVIANEKYKYSYGRAVYSNVASNMLIKLPQKNGEPDWQFMEDYIKSLPYGDRI